MTSACGSPVSCLCEFAGLDRLVASKTYRASLNLLEDVCEMYLPLARGEYNANFTFEHPLTQKRYVLRVNLASQMHLENQIAYEANALSLLANSGRTPIVYFCDDSKSTCKNGVLVEEFLDGEALDYENNDDFLEAATILADIHSVPVGDDCGLIKAPSAFQAIYDESVSMADIYFKSKVATKQAKHMIESLISSCGNVLAKANSDGVKLAIINTELNNRNFLMNGDSSGYLVDWEKPLFGDVAQDLGHFLADTTTLWKTNVVYSNHKKLDFIDTYIDAIHGRFKDVDLRKRAIQLSEFTKLRGITWCAMAYAQHMSGEYVLSDEFTVNKCRSYLEDYFV